MGRWFVSQRVRLVRPCQPKNMGLEGRIVAIGPFRRGDHTHDNWAASEDCDCEVLWDTETIPACCDYHRIEPILPEGMQPVSWESCLWQPEGEIA